MVLLELEKVSVGYGKEDVVKDISFNVVANENLSIIGPNGCGKTTLLRAIVNLLSYKGHIYLGDKELNKMKQEDIARHISMLSQISNMYFSYTVYEAVMMGRYVHIRNSLFGKPSKKDKEIVIDALSRLDILDIKDKSIKKLSGGQLQREFLARTLAQESHIILLDEPTNHLDLKYQIELIKYLNEWSKRENNVVIGVFHDINHALRLGGKILVMENGKKAAYGNIGKEIDQELLKKVYGIDISKHMKENIDIWENMS